MEWRAWTRNTGRITRLFRFRYTIKLYRYRVIARIVTLIKFTSGWHDCYWNQSNKLNARIGSGHCFFFSSLSSGGIYAAIKMRQLAPRGTRFMEQRSGYLCRFLRYRCFILHGNGFVRGWRTFRQIQLLRL